MIQIYQHYRLPLDQIDDKRAEAKAKFRGLVFHMTKSAPLPQLSRDQEIELVAAAQKDCAKAEQKLIEHHRPFLISAARRVAKESGCEELADDLLCVALEQFCLSLNHFELDTGNRLNTFVRFRVVGALRHYCLRNGRAFAYGKGSDERKAIYNKNRLLAAFKETYGRQATENDEDTQILADMCGISKKALKRGFGANAIKVIPAHHIEIVDPSAPVDETLEASKSSNLFEEAYRSLKTTISQRDFSIVHDIREDGCSNVELAKKHKISPERVGQIFRKSMTVLKNELAARGVHSRSDLH